MSDQNPEKEDLAEEFANLGKNLVGVLQAAWESVERKRLQDELAKGLNDLGDSLKREAEAFTESPTGQQLKADVEELGERLRSGETQEKARQEILEALRTANAELNRVIGRWSSKDQG